MEIIHTKLDGVLRIESDIYGDIRGYFREIYQDIRYRSNDIKDKFLQDNISFSKKRGTLRGLHFQYPQSQAKLITVLSGEIFDVAVDIRTNSPKFGQWIGTVLTENNGIQLYIPKGFAHGFVTLTDNVIFNYKCSDIYNPACEHVIAWDDEKINICWPVDNPIVSEQDEIAPYLDEIDKELLPKYSNS